MKLLTDRVVLITGASSGIGRAAALEFSKMKCKVAICARREDRLKELAETIGSECFYRAFDIRNRDDIEKFVADVHSRWGRLDVLLANAGYGYLARVDEIDSQEMQQIWEVNFLGTLYAIQSTIPHMKARKEGHMVIISSVVGRYALPTMSAYCATKFAQVALGESLRVELRESNIGVTLVYPGYTQTEFGQAQRNPKNRPRNLTRRGQNPETVARAIIQAVRKNKKEIYPNFTGSIFAHAGLYMPWLLDEGIHLASKKFQRK
jgi:short-subunit dehydrogenase